MSAVLWPDEGRAGRDRPTAHTRALYRERRKGALMKIGYCTWGMPTVPADTFIPFLAQLGYDGVELTVKPGYTTELSTLDAAERRRIARMLKDYDLELPAIAGHMPMLERDPDIAERN